MWSGDWQARGCGSGSAAALRCRLLLIDRAWETTALGRPQRDREREKEEQDN